MDLPYKAEPNPWFWSLPSSCRGILVLFLDPGESDCVQTISRISLMIHGPHKFDTAAPSVRNEKSWSLGHLTGKKFALCRRRQMRWWLDSEGGSLNIHKAKSTGVTTLMLQLFLQLLRESSYLTGILLLSPSPPLSSFSAALSRVPIIILSEKTYHARC